MLRFSDLCNLSSHLATLHRLYFQYVSSSVSVSFSSRSVLFFLFDFSFVVTGENAMTKLVTKLCFGVKPRETLLQQRQRELNRIRRGRLQWKDIITASISQDNQQTKTSPVGQNLLQYKLNHFFLFNHLFSFTDFLPIQSGPKGNIKTTSNSISERTSKDRTKGQTCLPKGIPLHVVEIYANYSSLDIVSNINNCVCFFSQTKDMGKFE